jgi:Lrp/AsnC family transcriptional regulator, leucine-responsive regulatory protein
MHHKKLLSLFWSLAQAGLPVPEICAILGPVSGPAGANRAHFRTGWQFLLRFGPILRDPCRMDRFDALLLEALQRNARATAEALSEQVALSPDACRKRLARLRASGIIEAEIAVLDPARVGRGLILIVEVTLQNERKADLDRFKTAMQAAPEVMQCYYVTGNADFILILSARDMADYDAFTRRHFFAEDNILRFRTSAVMDRVKTGFSLPLDSA